MGTAIVIVVVVLVVVIGSVAFLVARRTSAGGTESPAPPPAKVRPPEVPMNGLESALAAVTDRDGRPIGEKIDAEAGHVDELRDPDDTGPLLRRALDHVAPGDAAVDTPTSAGSADATPAERAPDVELSPGDDPADAR